MNEQQYQQMLKTCRETLAGRDIHFITHPSRPLLVDAVYLSSALGIRNDGQPLVVKMLKRRTEQATQYTWDQPFGIAKDLGLEKAKEQPYPIRNTPHAS